VTSVTSAVTRPFVLRCPRCLAPTARAATACAYCQVPLVWEPRESFGRDDRNFQHGEAAAESDPSAMVYVGFSQIVYDREPRTLTIVPTRSFRPTHLFIGSEHAPYLSVEDASVGGKSQRGGNGKLLGSAFSQPGGLRFFPHGDIAKKGEALLLVLRNESAGAQYCRGYIAGPPLEVDDSGDRDYVPVEMPDLAPQCEVK